MSKVRLRATLDMTIDMPDAIAYGAKGRSQWQWGDADAATQMVRDIVSSQLLGIATSGSEASYTASRSFSIGFHKLREELNATR